MALIYKIENKTNGKVYIGQTRLTLEQRLNNNWCGHFVLAFERNSNKPLYRALRKYGKDGFTYEVLEECPEVFSKTKENILHWLDKREQYWIDFYSSFNKNKGYNLTKGGLGPNGLAGRKGIKYSKELCKKVQIKTLEAMQKDTVKANHKAGLFKARLEGKLSHNKGRTYVTKGDILRFVFPDEAKRLVEEEGFEYGNKIVGKTLKKRFEEDPSLREKISETTKRGMWKPESRQRYLNAMSEKRRWLTNDIINIMVKESQVNNYIMQGWRQGRINKRKEV